MRDGQLGTAWEWPTHTHRVNPSLHRQRMCPCPVTVAVTGAVTVPCTQVRQPSPQSVCRVYTHVDSRNGHCSVQLPPGWVPHKHHRRGRAAVGGRHRDCISCHCCQKTLASNCAQTLKHRWEEMAADPGRAFSSLQSSKSAPLSARGLTKAAQQLNKSTCR